MARRPQKYLPVDRSKLRYWLVVSGLLLADVTPGAFASGTAIVAVGMALHLWSKGILRQNRMLAQTGPYALVRHPFYLANAVIDLGLCLIINRVEVAVIYFVFWSIAYSRAMKREERKLDALFGQTFRDYRSRVPGFVPWRVPISDSVWRGFSWRNPNIARGSEIPRLLRLASYPLLFVSASQFRDAGIGFFAELSTGLIALWSFFFLSCVSFALKRDFYKKRLPLPGWVRTEWTRNAFVLLLLGCTFAIRSLEIEMDPAEFLFGELLSMALFLLVFIGRWTIHSDARLPTIIEGAILIVICFLAELPWLSLLPLSYYSALWVNFPTAERAGAPYPRMPVLRMSWLRLQLILTAGVGLALWKETFDDLRGFLMTLW